MQLKCSRYIFTYTSPPAIVEDYILRSDDLASQTYGRDKYFSRLNQVLEQARFLGWPLPRFGSELPEELTEIPPAGVDHIFEIQAKLLIDVAPTTQVMLDDGRYCPVKMIAGTTAAGDLVWRCHLLSDTDGTPYVQRNKKRYRVKTKGTKIVCQAETLPYDSKYMFECFGGEESGIWPVPFLPEFFSDRAIAQKFSPEAGVVEVVHIHEERPVKVLAHEMVPWYRPLEINYTKALPVSEEEFDPELNVGNLISGWNDLRENEQITLDKDEDTDIATDDIDDPEEDDKDAPIRLRNVITSFSTIEEEKFKEYEKILASCKINSKAEANKLREDPKHKERAEKWLIAAVNRLRIIANCAGKIGALFNLLHRHPDRQVLVIQPRQKWASKLCQVLNQHSFKSHLFDPDKSEKQINKFCEGSIQILVTAEPHEDLFIDDLVIISVSAFDTLAWLEWINSTQATYCIAIKNLELADHNFIPEYLDFVVDSEDYSGPVYDILKLESENEEQNEQKSAKESEEAHPIEAASEPINDKVEENKSETSTETKEVKETKVAKPKFKIKIVGQTSGRPKTAASYEKALEMAQKQEAEGKKCEIYAPEGNEAVYITGIGQV